MMKFTIKFISVLLAFSVSLPLLAKNTAGKTIVAIGDVNATYQQDLRSLKRRSPIYLLDTVNTGASSNTQLRMIDGGLLSLQQQTQLIVNNYQFNAQSHDGAVSLKLLKGGLRTITGALKKGGQRYNLQTPVASIGVRGTHYEAELQQGDLYLSVWNGAIDVKVTVGNAPISFSLGESENYRFAIVHANGEVEFLLKEPSVFAVGHSEPLTINPIAQITKEMPLETAFKYKKPKKYVVNPPIKDINNEYDETNNSFIDNNNFWGGLIPTTTDIVATRRGIANFDNIISHNITTSAGNISDLSMSLTINFDTGRVPTGQLSFNDDNGQWFAVFNGIVNHNTLDMNINFASYNDELVNGSIDGIFLNNGEQILGNVFLNEIKNNSNKAAGSFLLAETP